jgi:hypothetical protein
VHARQKHEVRGVRVTEPRNSRHHQALAVHTLRSVKITRLAGNLAQIEEHRTYPDIVTQRPMDGQAFFIELPCAIYITTKSADIAQVSETPRLHFPVAQRLE